jgi:hypothetical protein
MTDLICLVVAAAVVYGMWRGVKWYIKDVIDKQ